MSLFKSILAKIFPSDHPATAAGAKPESAGGTPANAPAADAPAAAPAVAPVVMPEVDVHAVLADMQSRNAQKLNWQTSIVDLLKLLGLDSSLAARKELAGELGYTGDTDDSAAMNIWLHKEVMRKLADNGGKLPDELKG